MSARTARSRTVPAVLAAAVLAGCQQAPASAPGATTSDVTPDATSASPSSDGSTGASSPRPLSPAEQLALDTELRAAAWADDVPRAAGLVARGADVNAKDETQQSAYLIATSEGYLGLLELTLAHGAKVDDLDSWNGTGLIRAAERGHAAVVGRLLRAGISRDHVNRIGYQAIHEAVWLGRDTPAYLDTVRVLAAGGVTLTRPSVREGLTPAQMAQRRGFARVHEALGRLTGGQPVADPPAALVAAVGAGSADEVALAVRAGADLGRRDGPGRTVLEVARAGGHADVVRLLVALGAPE